MEKIRLNQKISLLVNNDMQDYLGGVPILLSKVVIFVLDESNLIDY